MATTKLDLSLFDEATRAFLAEHGAEAGYFHVAREGGHIDLYLSSGSNAIDAPPGIRSKLIEAASKTDGVTSSIYEFTAATARGPLVEPRRSQFPDTVEGHSQYMRELGLYRARTRDRNESAGLPPDGSPRMSRAAFDALDPLAKRQAMRDGVKLFDEAVGS